MGVLHVFLHSLEEAFSVFAFAFIVYFLLSFAESKVASLLGRRGSLGPAAGALLGVIPQCGISVVGADLYKKRHLSFGTLLALFLACSDEALPILLSSQDKWFMGLLLLAIKIAAGIVLGYLFDFVFSASRKEAKTHNEHCKGEDERGMKGCCGHHIEGEESALEEHLLHPLFHSLRMFLISLAVFFAFGLLMEYFETEITAFLSNANWLSPLYATVIGLVPNCASSVLLSSLYLGGGLPFGALLSGLCVNAGLGMVVLFQGGKQNVKRAAPLLAVLVVCSLALGYAFMFIG